jgi:hypothetical protein
VSHFTDNLSIAKRQFKAFLIVSFYGSRKRFKLSLLELIPQTIFYLGNYFIIITLFKDINGHKVANTDLVLFTLSMITADAIGDAIIFKGLGEYLFHLRKGNCVHFFSLPGISALKVLLFRFDLPMVIFGLASFFIAINMIITYYNVNLIIYYSIFTIFGIFCHCILSSAFFIIQAYFNSATPISYGNIAARLYIKPLQIIINNIYGIIVFTCIYPVYFVTAASNSFFNENQIFIKNIIAFSISGMMSIVIWFLLINFIVKKSIIKY